jgi:hypothetical protein
MKNGTWVSNGETIKFTISGRLIDGQHRLMACVLSGVTIRVLVARGLPENAQDTVDAGRKRTAADVLGLQGHDSAARLAAASAHCIHYQQQGAGTTFSYRAGNSVTHNEIQQFVDSDPFIKEAVRVAMDRTRDATPLMAPAMMAFLWWVLVQVSPEDCDAFFTGLKWGEDLPRNSPISCLRNKLIALRTQSPLKGTAPPRIIVHYTFKAWNHYRDGRPLKQLKVSSNEAIPLPR